MADYFDADQVLADEDRVLCTLQLDARGLRYLDPAAASAPEPDALPSGARLELPLWLAHSLTTRGFLSMALPPIFAARVRSELRADPTALNLYQKSPFYLRVGLRLALLLDDPGLPAALELAFAARCWCAVDRAQAASPTVRDAHRRRLDHCERHIFDMALRTFLAYCRWKDRTASRIRSDALCPSVSRKRYLQRQLDSTSARPRLR